MFSSGRSPSGDGELRLCGKLAANNLRTYDNDFARHALFFLESFVVNATFELQGCEQFHLLSLILVCVLEVLGPCRKPWKISISYEATD